jgi:hypothetical protein
MRATTQKCEDNIKTVIKEIGWEWTRFSWFRIWTLGELQLNMVRDLKSYKKNAGNLN